MKISRYGGALALATLANANRALISSTGSSQICAGIYAKHDYGGSFNPHVGVLLLQFGDITDPSAPADGIDVSFVIFEYRDIDKVGIYLGDGKYKYICDDFAINDLRLCNESDKGHFLLNPGASNSTVYTSTLTSLGQAAINYTVNSTGYYCVSTYSSSAAKYRGVVNFQNAFGQLSASEIPKLPAYGILTLCYAIALALFGFQFFKRRKQNQILPLQRYLLAMLGFLTFDTLVVWSYYDLVNRSSNPASGFVIFYGVFLALLNATKITFSFFLLLCIALGYGVVVLKLPKRVMLKCKILAGVLFAALLFYLLSSYITDSTLATVRTSAVEDTSAGSLLELIPLIPVTVCLTGFYVAIMVSIRQTTLKLHQQRQVIKLRLYENLFKIMFLSFFSTFVGLVLSSFIFVSLTTTDMIEAHWRGAYFVYEFWPSVVYFVVFMGIAWLWRPTETSYMLAISQQLSGTEDAEGATGTEFELDDISLMSHSDGELETGQHDSFELQDPELSPVHAKEPPLYSAEEPREESSHTLFDVGGDDDDDEAEAEDKQSADARLPSGKV